MSMEAIAACDVSQVKVVGGVRSGKTESLVQRAKALLESGVAPSDILVETTSSLAAQEFKARLQKAFGDDIAKARVAGKVQVKTAIEACTDVLSSDAAKAATGRNPRILAGVERTFLIEDLKPLAIPRRRMKAMLKHFFSEWARLEPEEGWLETGDEAKLMTRLREVLGMLEAMLPEEVAPLAASFLASDAGEGARKSIAYVLADDYQSLSRAEQTCMCLLAEKQIMVAGNAAQVCPIYTPRPHAQGFADFEKVREGVKVFNLEHGYGASRILEMSDALIGKPGLEDGIAHSSYEDERGEVVYVKWPSPEEEVNGMTKELLLSLKAVNGKGDETAVADGVSNTANSQAHEGTMPEDCLVLVPNMQWARTVEKVLKKRGFKTSLAGCGCLLSGDPRDSARSKALTSHIKLQLIANPTSMVAWRSWIGLDNAITNSDIIEHLIEFALNRGLTLYEALKTVATSDEDLLLRADVLKEKWASGQALIEAHGKKRGFALLRAVGAEKLSAFEDLMRIVAGDESARELAELELRLVDFPIYPEIPHCLRIATWRHMPGLSARWIYAMNCNDGLMPERDAFEVVSTDSTREKILDEERRLFAAGIAKAEERLMISYFKSCRLEIAEPAKVQVVRIRFEHGKRIALCRPTTFIAECGAACPGSISGQALLSGMRA